MRRNQATLLVAALAAAIPGAFAQALPEGVTGSVTVGGISTHETSDNAFRLHEYRDLDSGFLGGFDIRASQGSWYHRLFGENLGRDDQFIELKGGRYGTFKYSLYNDDIIHNYTFGAITPFTGVGSNSITFPGTTASTDIATWTGFDYSVKHKNYGGNFELQASPDSPFYLRVVANQKKSEGIRPLGAAGTSPGGPAYELPAPIDWKTTDVSGEIGYTTRQMHLSLNYLYSKFEDNNEFLSWRSPIVAAGSNIESSTIAMDNKLKRLGLNAVFRQLPLDSTLALRGTYTKVENSFPIAPTFLSVGTVAGVANTGINRLANPSEPDFRGEVVNKSFSAAYNSHLAKGFDSRIYYNYYERENNSSEIVFTPSGPGSGGTCDLTATGASLPTCSTEFLHFKKNNYGFDLNYRLSQANKLSGGLDYLEIERERIDFDRSKETKLWLEWKSGQFEVADFRAKYYHLRRKSDFLLGDSTVVFDKYLYRFDAAPLDRDVFKLTVEGSPMPMLDLGAEFIFKRNKYDDTVLGRKKDDRQEISLSGSWGDAQVARVTAFADFERGTYESDHWVGSTVSFPNPVPIGGPNCSSGCYGWSSDVKDWNYLFGVAGDWKVDPRLRLYGSYVYSRAKGNVDFETQQNIGNPVNITEYDNYKKHTLNLKAIWAATKQLDVTLGYAYEKYDYADVQMNGYFETVRTGSTQHYLSGAYAYPNYKANIVYGWISYRF